MILEIKQIRINFVIYAECGRIKFSASTRKFLRNKAMNINDY